jgi:lysine 2,3-aminomutase
MTTLRTAQDLATAGVIAPDAVAALAAVADRYAVAITSTLVDLIHPTDPADPIRRQFVPDPRELIETPDESADPIGDDKHSPVPGVVHRYPDRVLLKVTHACPVYCRFCFRREMVGPGGDGLTGAALDAALAYIAARPAIFEVILTGGDPFILSPRRIADLTHRIAAIPHVKVLRWHTRVPVVDPARVTSDLIAALKAPGTAVFVGLHANHAREFTPAATAAIARLVDAGIALISQTVLLKGINDTPEVMADLMRTFVAHRVKPYYLHHADRAPGTSHFRTTIAEGQALMRALRGRLSGLAQPTYILDIPGGVAKVPIGPTYLDPSDLDNATVFDPDGVPHAYKG